MQGSLHGWRHTGDTFSAIAVRSLRTCSVSQALCIASNLCVLSLSLSPCADKGCESMQYTSTPDRPLLSVQIPVPQRLLLIPTLRKCHSLALGRFICTRDGPLQPYP